MDTQRFDALTRRVGRAASRRQVLSAMLAGAVAHLGPRSGAAACKGYNAKCKNNGSCCGDAGLRCAKQGKNGKKHCRCRPGWARCAESDVGCIPVTEDVENCGACGNQCPAQTPCCFGGECQEECGGACCADCFVLIEEDGDPQPNSDECCPADKICSSNPKKLSDDRCCGGSEECVNGKCCGDGVLGSVVCGGKCCAEAACCNGSCCPNGKVCATTPTGDACVSANRACGNDQDCFSGETCHGDVCCAGDRICSKGTGDEFCCAVGKICELPGTQFAVCCPINTTCNSYKGQRVRR